MSVWLDPLLEWERQGRPQLDLDRVPVGIGTYLGTQLGEFWDTTRTFAAQGQRNQRDIEAAAFGGPELEAIFGRGNVAAPVVPVAEVNERVRKLGLSFDRPMTQASLDSIVAWREAQLERELIYRRVREGGSYGTAAWLASGALDLLMQASDPVNLASAFIPAMGPTRFALLAGRFGTGNARLARGALEGAIGALAVEPIYASGRREYDPDYALADSLINVAFGGVIGGGLHWLGGRYSDWSARRAPAAASTGGAAPPAVPDVPQGMAAALQRLRPETREALLRSAIAQLGDDRRVDVDAIARSDPDWRPPRRLTGEERRRLESPEAMQERYDRPELEAAARELAVQARAGLRAALPPGWVPDGFRPTAEQLAEARRILRGQSPRPEGLQGISLGEWVRRQGGVNEGDPLAGDLRAQDAAGGRQGVARVVQPRTEATIEGTRKVVKGHNLDDLATRATEDGFYPRERGAGERVELDRFLSDLIDDLNGRKRLYADDDVDAVRNAEAVAYNQATDRMLSEVGLDVAGLEPRTLAWLLSLDEGRLRREALARRIDRLSDDEVLEVLDIVDREIAASIEAETRAAADAQAARTEGFVPELEADPALQQRLLTQRPLSLDELEALHAASDAEGPARPGGADQRAAGDAVDAGARADAPAERAGPDQPADQAAPEAAGLRPEDGGAGAGRAGGTGGQAGRVQTDIGQRLRALWRRALADRTTDVTEAFGPVPAGAVARARDAEVPIEGYTLVVEAGRLRHIFDHHGSEAVERPRGQRAVTADDIARMPALLDRADRAVATTDKLGQRTLQFEVRDGDTTVMIAAVRRRHLALTNMWIKRGSDGGGGSMMPDAPPERGPRANVQPLPEPPPDGNIGAAPAAGNRPATDAGSGQAGDVAPPAKRSFEEEVAQNRQEVQQAEEIVRAAIAKDNPKLVLERGSDRLLLSRGTDEYPYRITTFDQNGPVGHRDYKADEIGGVYGMASEIRGAIRGGYTVRDEGVDAPRPLTPDDVEAHVQRQGTAEADQHADFEAQRRAEDQAGGKEPTAQDELADLTARAGELDERARAELEAAARPFDDETKAIEALAQCQIGDGTP